MMDAEEAKNVAPDNSKNIDDNEYRRKMLHAAETQAEAATRQAEALEKIANTLEAFHSLARAIVLLPLFGRLLLRLWALRGERN